MHYLILQIVHQTLVEHFGSVSQQTSINFIKSRGAPIKLLEVCWDTDPKVRPTLMNYF